MDASAGTVAAMTTTKVLHAFYYSKFMNKTQVLVPPEQPKREDRTFLNYAEKPRLKPVPTIAGTDEDGDPYSIGLEVHPIKNVIPRYPLPDIYFPSLQTWLDHLGQAIYNPLYVVQTPDGEYHSSRNGDHRSRCLWEIGEQEIRLIVRKAATTKLEGVKRSDWIRWFKLYDKQNTYPTATPYMFGLPRKKWKRHFRRYYPPLWKPTEVLEGYFNETRNDGKYFKDTLYGSMTFREIYSQWKQTTYRLTVIDKITERTDITDKSILDIGAFYGWASFMLLEMGARIGTAIEQNYHRWQVIKHIKAVRAYPMKVLQGFIQDYYKTLPHHDVILLLNVFHHILHQTEQAWNILNTLLQKCNVMYLMMGSKPQWGILKDYDNNVEAALRDNLENASVTPLFKTAYRNRVLFELKSLN